MDTLERAACVVAAAAVLAGCHETLAQVEPQLMPPAIGSALHLPDELPGLGDIIAGDSLDVTPPTVALRLIAVAEAALAAVERAEAESVERGNGAPDRNEGGTENRERARELIGWAKAALNSGDHARAVRRSYYACRLLGALPR